MIRDGGRFTTIIHLREVQQLCKGIRSTYVSRIIVVLEKKNSARTWSETETYVHGAPVLCSDAFFAGSPSSPARNFATRICRQFLNAFCQFNFKSGVLFASFRMATALSIRGRVEFHARTDAYGREGESSDRLNTHTTFPG